MTKVPIAQINRGSLPPELILDDFIYGFESSYENYLVDFVNESVIFSELSDGKEYRHSPKDTQNNGECDCCSEQYNLDFKLLGTQSSLYASRNLSLQKSMPCPGVIAKGPPNQTKDMEVALTNTLLIMYSLDDLLKIDNQKAPKFDRDRLSPETETKSILKIMKCQKNVLYFYKDFIFTEMDYALEDILKTLEPYINKCFSNAFKFRERFVSNRDTFLP